MLPVVPPESQLASCVTASWPGRHSHFPCIQGATTWAGTRGTARPGNSTMLTWQPRTKPTPESRALQTFVAIIPTSHCPVWLMVMAVMNHRRRQSLGASRRRMWAAMLGRVENSAFSANSSCENVAYFTCYRTLAFRRKGDIGE